MTNPFSTIYRKNLWNGDQSLSGPGSGMIATARTRAGLLALVGLLRPHRILDVGCGDGFWMPDFPGRYVGVDVTPEAVDRARRLHPERDYRVDDDKLPDCTDGLVICRDVIQHLSHRDGLILISRIYGTNARWLLASTYYGSVNVDIPTGLDDSGGFTFYSPDLTAPPFNLGEPIVMIGDGWDYDTGDTIRDPRKFLGLWDLDAQA